MPLPDTISVKYTEEEAAYLSVRPVLRQTFRLDELLDMLLGVTGKDLARLQQILRAGTVVFHFYRYWWPGFEANAEDLRARLARFPDADPARAFRPAECTTVLLEADTPPAPATLELRREEASRRRWFRKLTLWDFLMKLAEEQPPAYQTYSYARHADLYHQALTPQRREELAREVMRLAPRTLRQHLVNLRQATRVLFLCPRSS